MLTRLVDYFLTYARNRFSVYKYKIQSLIWFNYLKNDFKNIEIPDFVPGEEEYIKKWKVGDFEPSPMFYRLYSTYFKNEKGIEFEPIDILFTVIYKILNPADKRIAYADKNLYSKNYNQKLLPETYFRNINGVFMSSDYKVIEVDNKYLSELANKTDQIIIKPSLNSYGGKKVELFQFRRNEFVNEKNQKLDLTFLKSIYKNNYIAQERISQHPFLDSLNKSSLNTMRVITYRSVLDNDVKILGTYLRFGNPGSITDNVTTGGYVLHVDLSGIVSDFASDINVNIKYKVGNLVFNRIGAFPGYEQLLDVAKKIALKNPYQRILGLDLVLDKNNEVKLIEVNNNKIGGFPAFGQPIFGNYSDEIIDYCRKKINN